MKYKLETKSFNLSHPITVGSSSLTTRTTVLLHLEHNKMTGTGELSPLPGLTKIMLKEATKSLDILLKNTINKINLSKIAFDQPLFGIPYKEKIEAEVQFAYESAILDLLINSKDDRTIKYFSLGKFSNPPVNRLIDNLTHLDSYEYINTVKIKIGRASAKLETAFINELTKKHPHLRLRLDGNRKFTPNSLEKFADNINLEQVEYFEEPFSIKDHLDYLSKTKLLLAVDESFPFVELEDLSGICAIVLKPSNYLSISGTVALIENLKNKLPVTISHCYNGPHGAKILSYLAWYSNIARKTPLLSHGIAISYLGQSD